VDSEEARASQCHKLIQEGYLSRGLRLISGNGLADLSEQVEFRHMIRDMHPPREKVMVSSVPADTPMVDLDYTKTFRSLDVKAGTGTNRVPNYHT